MKDNRLILGAVRIGHTTYVAGEEDAFAAAASPAEIARLTEKGVISGDFKGGGKKSEPESDIADSNATQGQAPPKGK